MANFLTHYHQANGWIQAQECYILRKKSTKWVLTFRGEFHGCFLLLLPFTPGVQSPSTRVPSVPLAFINAVMTLHIHCMPQPWGASEFDCWCRGEGSSGGAQRMMAHWDRGWRRLVVEGAKAWHCGARQFGLAQLSVMDERLCNGV